MTATVVGLRLVAQRNGYLSSEIAQVERVHAARSSTPRPRPTAQPDRVGNRQDDAAPPDIVATRMRWEQLTRTHLAPHG
ncbi:hypothetical protein [Streptomyces sp. 1222.5]|uniref:hypothetical protein n=1 Tax=Streptomyces sp. 1222.5 TaxID=1881026 RepID=UPI003D73B1FD